MQPPHMRFFAVIPAYNEAASIAEVVRRTQPHVEEVVVVDDGSTDDTAKIGREAGAIVVSLPYNRGKGAALAAGWAFAVGSRADLVVTLDGDLQHHPEDIPRLQTTLLKLHADVVVGTRMAQVTRMPLFRRAVNVGVSGFLSSVAGQSLQDTQCGFRLYRTDLLRRVRVTSCGFEAESEILLKASSAQARIAWCPIEARYPQGRKSYIQPMREGLRFLAMLWRMARV